MQPDTMVMTTAARLPRANVRMHGRRSSNPSHVRARLGMRWPNVPRWMLARTSRQPVAPRRVVIGRTGRIGRGLMTVRCGQIRVRIRVVNAQIGLDLMIVRLGLMLGLRRVRLALLRKATRKSAASLPTNTAVIGLVR